MRNFALSTIKETGNAHAFLRMGFIIESEEISEIFESAQGEQVTLVSLRKKSITLIFVRFGRETAPVLIFLPPFL